MGFAFKLSCDNGSMIHISTFEYQVSVHTKEIILRKVKWKIGSKICEEICVINLFSQNVIKIIDKKYIVKV